MRCRLVIVGESTDCDLELPDSHAYSRIWVCPHCANIWAVLKCGSNWCYRPVPIPCLRCPTHPHYGHQLWPGSLLWNWPSGDGFDEVLMNNLPNFLLEREFNIHYQGIT